MPYFPGAFWLDPRRGMWGARRAFIRGASPQVAGHRQLPRVANAAQSHAPRAPPHTPRTRSPVCQSRPRTPHCPGPTPSPSPVAPAPDSGYRPENPDTWLRLKRPQGRHSHEAKGDIRPSPPPRSCPLATPAAASWLRFITGRGHR